MPTFDEDFAKYHEFATSLKNDLQAAHGPEKAERLYVPMNRKQFKVFRAEAATDSLKREWLARIRAGRTSALLGDKAA